MVSSSTMHNFPSPWRINYAGEIVRDVDVEETLRKVTPERRSFFTPDADAQKTKGKKESWFRIVRKKSDKKGESNIHFQGLDNILENMQCFSCGPMRESTDDANKKSRFLPTLTISKKGGKANDGKSKNEKVKKNEQPAASKDNGPTSTKEEQKTKWFQKKKQEDEPESNKYDIWAAVMPCSCTATEPDSETDKKDTKDRKQEQNKKTKLQWFRLSKKAKEKKKEPSEPSEPSEEESKGFSFNEFSAMMTALVNREAEQSEDKSETGEAATKQAGAEKTAEKTDEKNGAKDINEDTESNLAQWYERLKSDGEGYIRFVTGSDPTAENALATTTKTENTLKHDNGSLDGTIQSDGSQSTETWVTEFSSYEVPSLFQEMKLLTSFGSSKKPREHGRVAKAANPQEDEKFLLRKIANDPSSRRNIQSSEYNTLTLQTLGNEGTREHGFKVKLHQDRALCEV